MENAWWPFVPSAKSRRSRVSTKGSSRSFAILAAIFLVTAVGVRRMGFGQLRFKIASRHQTSDRERFDPSDALPTLADWQLAFGAPAVLSVRFPRFGQECKL